MSKKFGRPWKKAWCNTAKQPPSTKSGTTVSKRSARFREPFRRIFFSGSGLATALSTVDLAVSGPLIALGTFLSLVLASSCSVAGKFFSLKAAKHDKIQSLAEQTVVEISSLVSALWRTVRSLTSSFKRLTKSSEPSRCKNRNCAHSFTRLTGEGGPPTSRKSAFQRLCTFSSVLGGPFPTGLKFHFYLASHLLRPLGSSCT